VNQVPSESVFARLVDAAPFDTAQLERQFALANPAAPAASKPASTAGSRCSSEEPRKRLRVLDDRTSQMLAIAFNRLPPPERVAEMVETLEDFPDGLTSEAVLALHSAVSEHKEAVEQIRLVATTEEAIAQLDMPERFLLRLSSVTYCDAKLMCGALIVGSSKELMDLRANGQKVGVCCQDLRKSSLLRKCVSTSLAVGNLMNRGTSRSGVQGIVLPESLLKLDELRGGLSSELGESGDKDKNGTSLLDFVVQALINEEGAKEDDLQKDAENLLAKTRAAAAVSLEETEASCRQVNSEAAKVRQAIGEVPQSKNVLNTMERVNHICEEAALANEISQRAKEQLAKTQAWSCCKNKVKSDAWFVSWAQFLELLTRAITRARELKARRLAQEQEAKDHVREEVEPCRTAVQRPPLADANQTPAPEALRKSMSRSKAKAAVFDEDARIDHMNIDWSKLNFVQQENQPETIKRRSEPAISMAHRGKENCLQ
jgi:hypothetical protein